MGELMVKSVYDLIKRQNGEKFARSIRDFDSRLFEIENILQIVKYAGRDAEPILSFLSGLINLDKEEKQEKVEDPIYLLNQAGYNAFVVNTLEEKNSIEKYYFVDKDKRIDERICTLRDPSRHEFYYIVHAIKDGAENLNRLDFTNPERQDEYGTSVISIQMRKSGGHISIKNRYNHSVSNCDNTFNSNPDNIIEGLADSLQKYFQVSFKIPKQNIPNGFTYQNGHLYKYESEHNNVYFAKDSYLKNGVVHEINKGQQVLAAMYLIDLKEKTVKNLVREDDPYAYILTKEMQDRKIQKTNKEGKIQILLDKQLFLEIKENGFASKVNLEKTEELPDSSFLNLLSEVEEFNALNLKRLGDYSCCSSNLKVFTAPKLEEMGRNCLHCCPKLEHVELLELKKIGAYSLSYLDNLKTLCLPKVEEVGDYVISSCGKLKSVSLPLAKKIGKNALKENFMQEKLLLPQVERVDTGAISLLTGLTSLYLPNLEEVGDMAICRNENLKKVFAPKLKTVGAVSLYKNAPKCVVEAVSLQSAGLGSLDGTKYIGPKFERTKLDENVKRKLNLINEIKEKKSSQSIFSNFVGWIRGVFSHTR